MRILVGLGNPGREYEGSRHNAGYLLVEKLAGEAKWAMDKKFEAEVCKRDEWLLVKPMTFMNESGRAVRKIVDFYKTGVTEVILVHDDLDLKLGDYKIQKGVGPKIHNGVNSVERYLGEKNFWRVRLGVDNRMETGYMGSGADYVLEKFRSEERAVLEQIIKKALLELEELVNK